jgi:hypothetical protein
MSSQKLHRVSCNRHYFPHFHVINAAISKLSSWAAYMLQFSAAAIAAAVLR